MVKILLFIPFFLIYSSGFFISPVHAEWRVIPSLSLSESYDSNIYSSPDETEDLITTAGLNLMVSYTASTMDLTGVYNSNFRMYGKHRELNVATHGAGMGVNMDRWAGRYIPGLKVTAREDFTYTPELQDYYFDVERGKPGILTSRGVRVERNDSYSNAFSLDLDYPLSRRAGFTMGYTNLLTEYSNPSYIDTRTHVVKVGTTHAFIRHSLFWNGGVSNTLADSFTSSIYYVEGGIRYTLSPSTRLDFRIGVDVVDDEQQSGISTGLRGGVHISKGLRFFSLGAGYSQEANPSTGITQTSTLYQLFYLDLSRTHSRFLSSSLGGNYAINRSVRGEEMDISSYNIYGRLNYTFTSRVHGSLYISHFTQDSNLPSTLNITKDQVVLSITTIL